VGKLAAAKSKPTFHCQPRNTPRQLGNTTKLSLQALPPPLPPLSPQSGYMAFKSSKQMLYWQDPEPTTCPPPPPPPVWPLRVPHECRFVSWTLTWESSPSRRSSPRMPSLQSCTRVGSWTVVPFPLSKTHDSVDTNTHLPGLDAVSPVWHKDFWADHGRGTQLVVPPPIASPPPPQSVKLPLLGLAACGGLDFLQRQTLPSQAILSCEGSFSSESPINSASTLSVQSGHLPPARGVGYIVSCKLPEGAQRSRKHTFAPPKTMLVAQLMAPDSSLATAGGCLQSGGFFFCFFVFFGKRCATSWQNEHFLQCSLDTDTSTPRVEESRVCKKSARLPAAERCHVTLLLCLNSMPRLCLLPGGFAPPLYLYQPEGAPPGSEKDWLETIKLIMSHQVSFLPTALRCPLVLGGVLNQSRGCCGMEVHKAMGCFRGGGGVVHAEREPFFLTRRSSCSRRKVINSVG